MGSLVLIDCDATVDVSELGPGVVGGSIWVGTAGGGKEDIVSSDEEVSTVICFVVVFAFRRV